MSVTTVFSFPTPSLSADLGTALFHDAIAGYFPGDTPERFEERSLKRGTAWAKSNSVMVDYLQHPLLGPSPLAITAMWHDLDDKLSWPQSDSQIRHAGFGVQESDISAEEPPARLAFYRETMAKAFDVLRPTWGASDQFDLMGFGKKQDPRKAAHWLIYLGAEEANRAGALEKAGFRRERRPWGGSIVQLWESPFEPREVATAAGLLGGA